MDKGLIRSNVIVVCNEEGSVYTATEDSDKLMVHLQQKTAWYEGEDIVEHIRECEYYTDIRLMKVGLAIPGNIYLGLSIDPLGNEDECLYLDEEGHTITTPNGKTIYQFYYYSEGCQYQPTGVLTLDDKIEDILLSS